MTRTANSVFNMLEALMTTPQYLQSTLSNGYLMDLDDLEEKGIRVTLVDAGGQYHVGVAFEGSGEYEYSAPAESFSRKEAAEAVGRAVDGICDAYDIIL